MSNNGLWFGVYGFDSVMDREEDIDGFSINEEPVLIDQDIFVLAGHLITTVLEIMDELDHLTVIGLLSLSSGLDGSYEVRVVNLSSPDEVDVYFYGHAKRFAINL